MNQTGISESTINDQTIEKKTTWVNPDFTILSHDLIKGAGDMGSDLNGELS